jgi:protein-disulfide isomerase
MRTLLHSRRHGVQPILDAVASALIVIAAAAVMATAARFWWVTRRSDAPTVRADAENVPTAPQPLTGAAIIGNPAANVAVIEYSDFQCPYCGQFVRETWPELKKQYVDSGHIVFAFRHLPLPGHRFAMPAAVSAECAREQGRFWEMHDRLFERQPQLDALTGPSIARTLGFEDTAFTRCLQQRADRVEGDIASALALKISGTPTFLIGTLDANRRVRVSHVLVGARRADEFARVIEALTRPPAAPWWDRLLML